MRGLPVTAVDPAAIGVLAYVGPAAARDLRAEAPGRDEGPLRDARLLAVDMNLAPPSRSARRGRCCQLEAAVITVKLNDDRMIAQLGRIASSARCASTVRATQLPSHRLRPARRDLAPSKQSVAASATSVRPQPETADRLVPTIAVRSCSPSSVG